MVFGYTHRGVRLWMYTSQPTRTPPMTSAADGMSPVFCRKWMAFMVRSCISSQTSSNVCRGFIDGDCIHDSGPRCALHDQIQRYNLAHTELEPMQLGTTSKILTPQTQEPNQHVLASVEASTLTISVLVWHSHEFVDSGFYLEI
jgi:hypothetical protein